MRECNKCYVSKPLTDYQRAAHLKEGRKYTCTACVRDWGMTYREKNRVAIQVKKSAYQRATRKERRAGEIRYYQKHKDRHMACTAKRVKVRRRTDPIYRQKLMNISRAQYLKKFSMIGLAALFDSQLGRCANPLCGVSLKISCELDHVMPVALGGTHDLRNLQFLCLPCNRHKSNKHPEVWLSSLATVRG